MDCDADALLVTVMPKGPACHTGAESCFFNTLFDQNAQPEANLGETLTRLYELIVSRQRERPEGSYTTYLFDQGIDKILKKVGEDSTETVIAAKNDDGRLASETADLLYHLLVLMVERGVSLDEIGRELKERRKATKGN